MKLTIRRIFVILLTTLLIQTIYNDTLFGQDEKYPRGAQYFLGTNDQLLIKVNIWGFVAKPGQYLVPSDTDLISLISFAGGPVEGAKLGSIKLIRSELNKGKRQKVLSINVKKFMNNGDNSVIPHLKPGDTIIINGSRWYHFSKYLEIITKIAMLAQIYYFIYYYVTKE